MSDRNEQLFATVPKNTREEIRVTRKGHDLIVREWFQVRETGETRPGKGFAFRASLADEIIEALRAAKDGAKGAP